MFFHFNNASINNITAPTQIALSAMLKEVTLVDYDAKNPRNKCGANPPYKKTIFNFAPATNQALLFF